MDPCILYTVPEVYIKVLRNRKMQEKNILINIYVHIYWKLEATKIVRNKYNVCDYKYQIKHLQYNTKKLFIT